MDIKNGSLNGILFFVLKRARARHDILLRIIWGIDLDSINDLVFPHRVLSNIIVPLQNQ